MPTSQHIKLIEDAWCSEMLGLPCWSIVNLCPSLQPLDPDQLLSRINTLLAEAGPISLVTLKIPPSLTDIVNSLLSEQTWLVDTELIFRLGGIRSVGCDSHVRFVPQVDPVPFLPLADEMRWSRFFLDKRLERQRVKRLWLESLINHCQGRSDELAVYWQNSKPAGLVTLNFEGSRLRLFLVGVLPAFQRQGVGSELLKAVIFKYGNDYEIIVETSCQNIAAQRLYQMAGFQLDGCHYILHGLNEG